MAKQIEVMCTVIGLSKRRIIEGHIVRTVNREVGDQGYYTANNDVSTRCRELTWIRVTTVEHGELRPIGDHEDDFI